MARKLEVVDGKARVERVICDGYEVVEVPLPALVTVSNELGEVRHANVRGMMAAAKKNPIIWKCTDIEMAESAVGVAGRLTKILRVFQPVRGGKCKIIEAESPEEAGVKLAEALREAKIV
jgi:electron transfer flavoprotein beta subunit